MNAATPAPASGPSHSPLAFAIPQRPDWHILVSAIPGRLEFAIKCGDEIVSRHEAATFAEIRGYEIRAGIWHVTVDGPDTPDLHQAIALYAWHEGPSLAAMNVLRSTSPASLAPRAA